MAKYSYMMTRDYVPDWTLGDAVREIISNGIDAEIEQDAPLQISHHGDTLTVTNHKAKIDHAALRFGGGTKPVDSRYIGQYKEGMKLALLILAREGLDVKVINDDESWTPSFEEDEHGHESFVITTRKRTSCGEVRVIIPGLSDEVWDTIQTMFLRLCPPANTISTEVGTILLDAEYGGKRYVRGVWINQTPGGSFGYDFKNLNVGRDRRSYRQYEANALVAKMWEEASSRPEVAIKLYRAMVNDGTEFRELEYYTGERFSKNLVTCFREQNGEDAFPVLSTSEGLRAEHLGFRSVTLPGSLVKALRKGMPTLDQIATDKSRSVTRRYSARDLNPAEAQVLSEILDMGKALGITTLPDIVDFQAPDLEGTYSEEGGVRLARSTLASFGKAMGVYIHEAAHVHGGDAEIAHMDGIHEYMEKALDKLYSELRGLRGERGV